MIYHLSLSDIKLQIGRSQLLSFYLMLFLTVCVPCYIRERKRMVLQVLRVYYLSSSFFCLPDLFKLTGSPRKQRLLTKAQENREFEFQRVGNSMKLGLSVYTYTHTPTFKTSEDTTPLMRCVVLSGHTVCWWRLLSLKGPGHQNECSIILILCVVCCLALFAVCESERDIVRVQFVCQVFVVFYGTHKPHQLVQLESRLIEVFTVVCVWMCLHESVCLIDKELIHLT